MANLMLAMNQFGQGRAAKKQLYRQAGAEQASSQRDSIAERKRGMLLKSRALAVAAASGGGVDDPTVHKLLSDIGAQGEVNALSSLWEGDETAEGLRADGRARQREGVMRGASTILSMGQESAGKYG
jgi:hypothetical protein